LILDEPTNHLDMPSKDVLKEAIKAFDGTAIIVSHDREFLDGLVTKVYEFGGGKVREHIGGIYDFLQSRKIADMSELEKAAFNKPTSAAPATPAAPAAAPQKQDYAERKEQQKRQKRAEKAVEESEKKIAKMEQRLKELDALLCDPKNASDMTLVTEYTDTKRQMDQEVERWEKLSEELQEVLEG
jgi:ATP-binding cassette subfamily F protein 3